LDYWIKSPLERGGAQRRGVLFGLLDYWINGLIIPIILHLEMLDYWIIGLMV